MSLQPGPRPCTARTPQPCPSNTLPIFPIRKQRLASGNTQGDRLCPNAPNWAGLGGGGGVGMLGGDLPWESNGPPSMTQMKAKQEEGHAGLGSAPHPQGRREQMHLCPD